MLAAYKKFDIATSIVVFFLMNLSLFLLAYFAKKVITHFVLWTYFYCILCVGVRQLVIVYFVYFTCSCITKNFLAFFHWYYQLLLSFSGDVLLHFSFNMFQTGE